MKIVLTGSSGPLGQIITELLNLSGHEVVGCARFGGANTLSVDVLTTIPYNELRAVDAVVYGAWDSSDRSLSRQIDHADASIRWADACHRLNKPFVFLSSTLAFAGSLSHYGQAKYRAEQQILELGGTVLRIGLVCDDSFFLLSTNIRKSKLVRASSQIFRRLPVFPVSSTSVGEMIVAACKGEVPPDCYWTASNKPISIDQVLRFPDGVHPKLKKREVAKRLTQTLSNVNRYVPNFDRVVGLLSTPTEIPLDCKSPTSKDLDNWAEHFMP